MSRLLEAGELSMAAFGTYSVGLFFQNGLKINIGTSWRVKKPDGVISTWEPERDLGDLRMFAPWFKVPV